MKKKESGKKWNVVNAGTIKAAEDRFWLACGGYAEAIALTMIQSPEFLKSLAQFAIDGAKAFISVTSETARDIMGQGSFFGPEEIEQTWGIKLVVVPEIPFSFAELERAKELGQQLILYVDQTSDGQPLTIEKMNEIRKGQTSDGKKLLYQSDGSKLASDTWYKDEEFIRQTPRIGWRLTTKEVIPDSTNKDYLEQTQALIDYLTKEMPISAVTESYSRAISEFDAKKAEIAKLLLSDWKKARVMLKHLEITSLLRETPAEVVYRLTIIENTTKDRPLAIRYAWTNESASDGRFVYVGAFGAGGLGVNGGGPRGDYSALGACFSRGV